MNRVADFRSDTFTVPDDGMRRAMYEAEVGDSSYGEDPSVNALEAAMAEFFACEAAVFLPSATMAGQIAIHIWTRPGEVVLIERFGHNYFFETGSMALISAVQAQPIAAPRGILTAELLQDQLVHPENHHARTGLIVLENTSNFGGGTCYPPATLGDIFALAGRHGLPIHVDGARIWNALAASPSLAPAATMATAGSMSVCFSKGLGAPVGAALLGEANFVRQARRVQKLLGGAMRQAGFMAAAALYGFHHHRARLSEDHANARRLGEALARVPGLSVDLEGVQTNMVYVDVEAGPAGAARLVARLEERGIRAFNLEHRIRFVTSMLVDRSDCERAAEVIAALVEGD